MSERAIENIKVFLALSVLPLVLMCGAFMISAINCWELWRAFIGLVFLVMAGINFSLVLIMGN